ncbi:hypothetical protein DNH61_01325 [Paenibacillus sambharensis]|uniref:Spore coat protein n=1 Tax=Paenibacillus sambharensis TaxID=1803190 RepID=A0A2W1M179_9BACL|nr:hypothetical protein [Paenibacillus sambharensis]PZD97681.1 hypothetical protein DNH61_01325 [Paenibacillus sambharensis]
MNYALHESLEVHEMAVFKAVCLTNSKTMSALVSDEELKRLMLEDVQLSTRQLQELDAILAKINQ